MSGGWTAEHRRRASERLKELWADPAYREKAINELAYARCSPSFKGKNYTPEISRATSERTKRFNADPEFRRHQREAAKAFWATPDPKWLSQRNTKSNDTRRGFKVPLSKRAEYQFLRKNKKLGAREAGRILGLI